jgi:hypothetical protein
MLTTKLNNGCVVLAKLYKGDVYAVTYANITQAEKSAAKLQAQGVECKVIGNRPYFVHLLNCT